MVTLGSVRVPEVEVGRVGSRRETVRSRFLPNYKGKTSSLIPSLFIIDRVPVRRSVCPRLSPGKVRSWSRGNFRTSAEHDDPA